jgi:hypothetical protein
MHVIRLRTAWDLSPEDHTDSNESNGRSCFQRSFGKPTNLGGEQVRLVIKPPSEGDVRLNGSLLPAVAATEKTTAAWDVTQLLNVRNSLSIETNSPTFDHEVWLEIVE